jgi:hypothetical protein
MAKTGKMQTKKHGSMSTNGVLPLAPSNYHSTENRPMFFDEQGRCHGFVERIDFTPADMMNDGYVLPDRYCWHFICVGTLKPYIAQYWTGTRWTTGSKLVALWNSLGLSHDEPQVDLAQGLPVVFKLERRNGQYNVVSGLTTLDTERDVQLTLV